MITAYYNEFDHKAAAWLRQLIKNGSITQGEVDERSITEVRPDDLIGFNRCHFFAGIGTWDYCLNQSGWGDKPVWTASLPCQPFSTAGKGLGKEDERHLLPHYIELVRECRPDTQIGEQVEKSISHGWLDDLQTSMEREGYAIGHCVLGAHSVNAPHIRQRLYWVANRMGISDSTGLKQGIKTAEGARHGNPFESTGGVEWIWCRDNKYRPIEPGIQPLVNGITRGMVCSSDPGVPINANATQEARTMRLKGYGNAIQAQTAIAFIKTYMDINL